MWSSNFRRQADRFSHRWGLSDGSEAVNVSNSWRCGIDGTWVDEGGLTKRDALPVCKPRKLIAVLQMTELIVSDRLNELISLSLITGLPLLRCH